MIGSADVLNTLDNGWPNMEANLAWKLQQALRQPQSHEGNGPYPKSSVDSSTNCPTTELQNGNTTVIQVENYDPLSHM